MAHLKKNNLLRGGEDYDKKLENKNWFWKFQN